jgi:hypothetical protein
LDYFAFFSAFFSCACITCPVIIKYRCREFLGGIVLTVRLGVFSRFVFPAATKKWEIGTEPVFSKRYFTRRGVMRGKVNIGLLTAAAFFAVFGKASVAEADYCDDPGQGLRACDQPRSGCEASRDPFGLNPFEVGADYTSYVEGILYLENLDADYDPDNVLLLADMPWSYEIVEQAGGNTTQKKYFPVAKITVDVEDGPYEERPDMVFVCDMHAREWTTSEACMALIDELVQNSADPDIADLLSAVEVWVVPYANPGGRYFEEYDHSIGKPITDYGEPWNKQISWRKNRYWTEDCETTYQNNPHTGDCNAAAGEYDGANVARNFSDGWQQASSDTVFDRAKMFPNYVDQQATPDHIQEPPEIHDCGGFNNQCPADHPNCVAWNQILVAGLPINVYGCFMQPSFTAATANAAWAACNNSPSFGAADGNGIVHTACQRVPNPTTPNTYVLTECGVNSPAAVFRAGIDASPLPFAASGLEKLPYCGHSLYVGCDRDFDCFFLRGKGYFSADPWFNSPADVYCSPEHRYCAYDGLRTCCSGNYQGTEPFEAPEARLIRHLVLNAQAVALVDIHNHGAYFSMTTKVAPGGFNVAAGVDMNNIVAIRDEAANISTTDDRSMWQSLAAAGAVAPDFFDYDVAELGGGVGQLPSWAARMPTADDPAVSEVPNFDNDTYRGINAFNIELPPWHMGDTQVGAEREDWGDHMSCDTSPSSGDGYAPQSRMAVRVSNAGFLEAAKYLIEQAATPLIGYDSAGAPFAARADTGVVGLLVHDGSGKGVIHGQVDNAVYVPAGRWAISSDVLYQNSRPAPWDTNYVVKIDAFPLFFIALSANLGRHRTFNSEPNVSPGDLTRYEMRFEFEPGKRYQVSSELDPPVSADDDTLVNDIRVTKVETLGCASGSLPDSTEHAGAMTSDEFCGDRIEGDENRFFCNEDKDRCQECGLDPIVTSSFFQVNPCSRWHGAGAFCVDGMCDTPDACWSATFEDDFEGLEPIVIKGVNNAMSTFAATLHQDPGGDRDQDTVRYDPPVLSGIVFGNKLAIGVSGLCEDGLAEPDLFEVNAVLGAGMVVWPLSNTIVPWTSPAPGSSKVSIEVVLTDSQLAAVKNGTPITVNVRSKADPSTGDYPSLVYRIAMGLYVQSVEPPIFDEEEEQIFVPPFEPIAIQEVNDRTFSVSLVPDEDQVEIGNKLVYRPTSGIGAATVRISVTNAHGQSVGKTVQSDEGIEVLLSTLDPGQGPFTVTLQSSRTPLDGIVYHCPYDHPDCLEFDTARDACGGESCARTEVCCRSERDAVCSDISNDVENCGACGKTCSDRDLCLDGVCAQVWSLDCRGTRCPRGFSCCEDDMGMPECVDPRTDNDNCGWCGYVCPGNRRCAGRMCVPRAGEMCGAPCSGGKTCCYDLLGRARCADTATSRTNCGKCGNVCGWNETCSNGKCVPWLAVYDPCWGRSTNCGAPDGIECRNLHNDESNCGYCGVRCAEGAECVSGRCVMEEYLFTEAEDE